MLDPDKQFSEAMKQFNHAIGSHLLPAVTKAILAFTQLVPVVSQAAGTFGNFIGWFAENPFSGLGAIVLGSVAKDLATAGIGSAVQSTLDVEYGRARGEHEEAIGLLPHVVRDQLQTS